MVSIYKVVIGLFSFFVIALVISFIFIFILNNEKTENISEPSPPFVASENEVALLIVGEFDMSSEEIKDDLDVSNLHKITTLESIDEFNKSFTGVKLERSPAFILFDNKEPIYTIYSYEELVNYVNMNLK